MNLWKRYGPWLALALALSASNALAAPNCNRLAQNVVRLGAVFDGLKKDYHDMQIDRDVQIEEMTTLQKERCKAGCICPQSVENTDLGRCRQLNGYVQNLIREIDQLNLRINENKFQRIQIEDDMKADQASYRNSCGGTLGGYTCKAGYSHFPNQAIADENIRTYQVSGVAECLNKCTANPDCRSIDYGTKNRWCFLSDKNRYSNPAPRWRGRPNNEPEWPYDYYEKCG